MYLIPIPDSKVHEVDILLAPGGPHVGLMLAQLTLLSGIFISKQVQLIYRTEDYKREEEPIQLIKWSFG